MKEGDYRTANTLYAQARESTKSPYAIDFYSQQLWYTELMIGSNRPPTTNITLQIGDAY